MRDSIHLYCALSVCYTESRGMSNIRPKDHTLIDVMPAALIVYFHLDQYEYLVLAEARRTCAGEWASLRLE